MERTGRLPIAVMAIGCLVGGVGCTMCPDPYDYSGPVPNGSVAQNDFHARSNGITPLGSVPLPWPTVVDATPARGADAPTIADAEPAEATTVPDDALEIPTAESVLSDDAEVASEPGSIDVDAVRMLSAAEDAGPDELTPDELTEMASPTNAPAQPEPRSESTTMAPQPEADADGAESDLPDEPGAAGPPAVPRRSATPNVRPRVTARRPAAPAARLIERSAAMPRPRIESVPATVDLQPVVTAEPPRQPQPAAALGLSETPGWRPRGYVRPPTERR